MKLDNTIRSIVLEIQNELKDEKGIDLTPEEIFNIANSQFIAGSIAKTRGISFRLPYIGNFIFKNKQAYTQSLKEVEKLKDKVSPEEYKEIIKQKRIANKNTMKNNSKLVIKELEDLPDQISNISSVKYWNKVYNEVIEAEI